MELSVVILQAPKEEYLSLTNLTEWLGFKADRKALVRKLVRDKVIPGGRPRPGYEGIYWTREDAAIAKWRIQHDDRYNGMLPGEKGKKPPAG